MIESNHKEYGFKVIRQNMEEITLQGWNGEGDQRTVNSYPSKVKIASVRDFLNVLLVLPMTLNRRAVPLCTPSSTLGMGYIY